MRSIRSFLIQTLSRENSSGGRQERGENCPLWTEIQVRGFSRAAEGFLFDHSRALTANRLENGEILQEITDSLSSDDGMFRISASALNLWSACPFSYLLQYALKITEDEYVLQPEDPMVSGSIMHEILCNFFNRLIDSGERFDGNRLDEYERIDK